MAVIRKSITFIAHQNNFVKSVVEAENYTNDSEYIRDLIRKDQINKQHDDMLSPMLVDGMESRRSAETVGRTFDEAIREHESKK